MDLVRGAPRGRRAREVLARRLPTFIPASRNNTPEIPDRTPATA